MTKLDRLTSVVGNRSRGSLCLNKPVVTGLRAKIASLLIVLLVAEPLIAQSATGIRLQTGMVVRLAAFFAGQQGRWAILTAWTILFATEEKYDFALICARKAVQISESSHDDARYATSQRYLAVLLEARGKLHEAATALEAALAARERNLGPANPAVADLLLALARNQRLQGKIADALPMLNRAAMLRAQKFGHESVEYSDVLLEQATLLSAHQQYSESDELFRGAIAIKQRVLGADNPDLAEAQRAFAESLLQQKRYPEAEAQAMAALTLLEKISDRDDPTVLPALNTLTLIYEVQGKAGEAGKLRERLVTTRSLGMSGVGGEDTQRQWTALVSRSFTLFNAAETADETAVALSGLRYAETKFGPEDWRVAAFLVILARQYYSGQAAFSKAETTMLRAIRIQEKTLGTEDASLAETLLFYGLLLTTEHKFHEAEAAYCKATRIQEQIMNIRVAEDPFMHSPRLSLAAAYQLQGRFPEAEGLFTDAIKEQEQAGGAKPPRNYAMVQLLQGLAYIYETHERPDKAVPLLQRALIHDRNAWGIGWGGYKRDDEAGILTNLGDAYVQQHDYREAETAYLKAVTLYGRSQTFWATSARWKLASAYRAQRKFAEAEKVLRDELRPAEKSRYSWHIDQTSKYLAYLNIDQGRYREAGSLLERSRQIEKNTLYSESPRLGATLYEVAANDYALGERDAAALHFQESFAILSHELQYYFSYMSEAERLRVLQQVEYRFPTFYSFVETFRESDPKLAGQMYNLLLWKKGLVARSIESLRRKIASGDVPGAVMLFDDLAVRRTQIAAYLNVPTAGTKEWLQKMANLEYKAAEVEQELVSLSKAFANQQKQQSYTWEDVRESLKKSNADAAVEFVRFPFRESTTTSTRTPPIVNIHYAALIVTQKSVAPAFVPLADAKVLEGEPLNEYRRWVGSPIVGESAHAPQTFYEGFWRQIESVVLPATSSERRPPRVYVSPDGIFNEISLGVLPTDDGHLLMEKYDLRIVDSTGDLLRAPPPANADTAILVGNPTFKMSESDQQRALAELNSRRTGSTQWLAASETPVIPTLSLAAATREAKTCVGAGTIPCLPNTEDEVDEIRDLLVEAGWQPDIPYVRSLALEEVVKQVAHPRLLHVATHGFFCSDLPEEGTRDEGMTTLGTFVDPMLRSGLLFAGAERSVVGAKAPPHAENGVMTAYEASLLDLEGTELVVLSACETGLGYKLAGEGVLGLRRAIQEAGSQAVLISMWRVPTVETQQLMSSFYRHWLAGNDKHEALRSAQLHLRDELRKVGRDSPYYWGAFVLVGR